MYNNIHMNKTYIVALVAVLLTCSFTADCPVEPSKQPRIYSDSVGLSAQDNKNAGNAQNLVYQYKFESNFPEVPKIAIGLNQIQAAPSPSLDLRVTNAKTTTGGVYFQAESGEQSQWKQFKINFLASSRDDIELGSATISSPVVNPNDNTFNVIYNIKGNLPVSGLKAKSFLQGINLHSTDKTQIGIKQESSSVSNKQIFFTFSSPLRTSIVRSLTISVIVFNVYTPSVLYADGVIDQNYVVSTLDLTIPRHGINELRTYIVGINSFQTTAQKPISIFSAVSQKFTIVIGPIDRSQIDFISVSYLILSVIDCGSCAGNPILFEGICQPICPQGYTATKGRCVPEKCKQGQKFNEKQECVDICTGVKQIYQNGHCVCVDGYYRINKVCDKCSVGTYYDFRSLSCKPLCGVNSQYKNGKCYCKSGFYVINNKCQQCTYGTIFNAITKRCENICKSNEIYSPQGCVCANGYSKVNDVCIRCPYQTVYDPDLQKCVCAPGLDFFDGQCLPACGKYEERVSGTCVCIKGYYWIDGGCKQCGSNSQFSTYYGQCVCNEGYIQTPIGCAPNCTDQQYFLNGKCKYYCKSSTEVYIAGVCQCLSDHERINKKCVPSCLPNEYRDINGVCQCLPGYFKGSYPICQLANCPPGTAYDPVRQDCLSVCKPNEVYINGACVCGYGYNNLNAYGDCVANCTAYQVNVNGFCQCPAGYARAALGVCCPLGSGPGKCPPGSIYMYGLCVPPTLCGANQYWCGTQCVCSNGYYRVNGQCIQVQPTLICPRDSVSNGVNCLCKKGLYPTSPGVCQQCPDGSSWDGYQCNGGNDGQCKKGWKWNSDRKHCESQQTCKDHQQWDGVRCRCQQGYYYVSGKCQTCPDGTVFDGYKCSPGKSTKVCKDPYSFWNGYACACLSGYWPLADGKCVPCPDGTYWDGTCCKPKNGKYIPLTTVA